MNGSDSSDVESHSTIYEYEKEEVTPVSFPLLDLILNKHDELPGQPFWDLPPESIFPDYYKICLHPISLKMIKAKTSNPSYLQSDLINDIQLLIENTKAFYTPTNQYFLYALEFQVIVRGFLPLPRQKQMTIQQIEMTKKQLETYRSKVEISSERRSQLENEIEKMLKDKVTDKKLYDGIREIIGSRQNKPITIDTDHLSASKLITLHRFLKNHYSEIKK